MATQLSGKDTFVGDWKPGDRVTTFFLVRQKQMEPFRDQSKGEFLTLMLADRDLRGNRQGDASGQYGRTWERARGR